MVWKSVLELAQLHVTTVVNEACTVNLLMSLNGLLSVLWTKDEFDLSAIFSVNFNVILKSRWII